MQSSIKNTSFKHSTLWAVCLGLFSVLQAVRVAGASLEVPSGGKLFAKPVEVARFGPNGTHWPLLISTPFIYDTTLPHRIEVDCTWTAIKAAIVAQTERTVAEGVIILVRPGALVGGTVNTPSSAAMLDDCGSAAWPCRITVAPRDGYGTVQITEGGIIGAPLSNARIRKVHGVCFAGFQARAFRLTACVNTALAWTKLDYWLGIDSYEGNTSGVEMVEVVIPNHRVETEDTAKVFAHDIHTLDNLRFAGCYFAPRYRPEPSQHSDTIQFHNKYGPAPVGTIAPMSNIIFKDCALFASNNSAIQTGIVNGMAFYHCYIAAAAPSLRRHPFPPDYAGPFSNNPNSGDCLKPLNGAPGKDYNNFQAHNSIIIGAMVGYDNHFTEVVNSKLSRAIGSGGVDTGAWTIEPTLEDGVPEDFNVPLPTDAYLNSIWKAPAPSFFPKTSTHPTIQSP